MSERESEQDEQVRDARRRRRMGDEGRGGDKVRMKDRGGKVRMMVRGDMVKEKGSYGSGYGKGFPWRCEWLVVIDSVVFV